jgi:hypothetical protein
MKTDIGRLIYLLLITVSISGCEKANVVSKSQEILFQQEYINYAGAFQHHGYIIDIDGNVLSFNNPDKWNFPDKDGKLTEKQVKENIASCTLTGKKLSKTDLNKYINYIDNISSSKVTAPKTTGNDMGSLVYSCYQFSENNLTYKATKIKMEGDSQCENLNYFSKKVVHWMKKIDASLPK